MLLVMKKMLPLIIIVACISLTLTLFFNIDNTLITQQTINGINIKQFNLYTYTMNINNLFTEYAIDFKTILPSNEWQNLEGSVITAEFWKSLFNNILVIFEWVYFPINFLLYVIRWILWFSELLLGLIGYPIDPEKSTLITIIEWCKTYLIIPKISL